MHQGLSKSHGADISLYSLGSNEIRMCGTVGIDFDAEEISQQLSVASGPIEVYLNSGGGIASEGAAIHSVLARYRGRKTVIVQGIAASAASLIAMAGDRIEMSAGSMLMIHDPSQDMTVNRGTSAEHRRIAEGLDSLSQAVAQIYAQRSGKSTDEIRKIMAAESWFTLEEAVAAGFADVALGGADETVPAAFDYSAYAHSPEVLVKMSVENGWTSFSLQEKQMTETTDNQDVRSDISSNLPSSLNPTLAMADRDDPKKELKRIKALTTLAATPLAQEINAIDRLEGWISEGVTHEAAVQICSM